jgi:hypothetical protein
LLTPASAAICSMVVLSKPFSVNMRRAISSSSRRLVPGGLPRRGSAVALLADAGLADAGLADAGLAEAGPAASLVSTACSSSGLRTSLAYGTR